MSSVKVAVTPAAAHSWIPQQGKRLAALQCFTLKIICITSVHSPLTIRSHVPLLKEEEWDMWCSRWLSSQAPLELLWYPAGNALCPESHVFRLLYRSGGWWGWVWVTSDPCAGKMNVSLPMISDWILLSHRSVHWNPAKGNILTFQCNFLRYVWKWSSLYLRIEY